MIRASEVHEDHYDTIIIGSGMGGLATASLLAQIGKKKVLVLESHFKFGGFLHSFRRKKYVWDPGVHYIGEMQDGSLTRQCMDLVTGSKVRWHAMSDNYERFVFPNATFDAPKGKAEFEKRLIERFPNEEKNIKEYFKDVTRIQNWTHRWFLSKQFPKPISSMMSLGKKLALTNTREYVESRFQEPLLRAIVTAQWPDYGTPPGKSAFGIHAAVQSDFFNGGYYPVGGSQKIADSAVKTIEEHGGTCLLNHPVSEIIIENNRAKGVVVNCKGKSKRFFSKNIVSGTGARLTFTDLVPDEFGKTERDQLANIENGTSAVILFMGLNDDPGDHGFKDCNYWLYDRLDFDKSENAPGKPEIVDGCFVAFGSMRDPECDGHAGQIVGFSREPEWIEFAQKPWLRRGDIYEKKKEARAQELIDFAEERLPGLKNMIAYKELSSPLSIKSFTNHHGGAIYGQECDQNRISGGDWQIGTSVKNLYLTGSDVGLPGVNGALMAGVMTAGKLLGWLGMPRILVKAYSTSKPKESR